MSMLTGKPSIRLLFYIRGGVMFWADSLGAKYVYDRLEAWSKDYGELFKPCEYLAARARQGASLVIKDLGFLFLHFVDASCQINFSAY
jgi:hypothetical protein